METSITDIWEGEDKKTRTLAKVVLKTSGERAAVFLFPFGEIKLFARPLQDRLLLYRLKRLLQPIADETFGKGEVKVKAERVASGSILATLLLVSAAKAAWEFFRDFKDVKEGLAEFRKDVEAAGEKIEKIIHEHFPPPTEAGPSLEAAVRSDNLKATLAALALSVLTFELASWMVTLMWTGTLNHYHFPYLPNEKEATEYLSHSLLAMSGVGVINLICCLLGGGVAGYRARRAELTHAVAFWCITIFVEALMFGFAPETTSFKWPLMLLFLMVIFSLPFTLAGGLVAKMIRVLGL